MIYEVMNKRWINHKWESGQSKCL